MANDSHKDFDDDLLDHDGPEHTSVTMKLAIIQKPCADLLDDEKGGFSLADDDSDGLSLADDESESNAEEAARFDPYGRG